jgi:hypothetical protein
MQRLTMHATAIIFLLLNWAVPGFSQTQRPSEDILLEQGSITQEEYNVLKEYRSFYGKKQQQLQGPSVSRQKKPVWELQTEISQITYKEPGIQDKGMMQGLAGSYTYYDHDNLMLKAEGRFSYGKVDYTGSLQDGTPYTIGGINDYMLELRGLGGCDFSVNEAAIITPYAGIGYRYLNDDSSFDAAGYLRESKYIYSPVGIESVTNLKSGWSIGATAEYDIFWRGQQISHLSKLAVGLSDCDNAQSEGYGARGSIKIMKKSERLDFIIEPFIRYWNIGQSDNQDITYYGRIIGYGYEPDNNSTEIGCKLALKF